MKILVTGGAGFIGSCLIRQLVSETSNTVVNVDKLTYAGNLESLKSIENSGRYHFEKVDICNRGLLVDVFNRHRPDAVMHLAAESHVDRSIDGPAEFVHTNVVGTYTLLQTALEYWKSLPAALKDRFRFLHVSTDEVFGDLGDGGGYFDESAPYEPSSPYSATKAAADHLARAWCRTYGLPVLVTNCSNNYGPYHFPEKLVPLMILNALEGKPLPVYGDGGQVRDWLYVEDHTRALWEVLQRGRVGDTYNIGGNNPMRNVEVVSCICRLLEDLAPNLPPRVARYSDLITFVRDRPGHDRRYAIDASKIRNELGWVPRESVDSGFRKTVLWYLSNREWWEAVQRKGYRRERLG